MARWEEFIKKNPAVKMRQDIKKYKKAKASKIDETQFYEAYDDEIHNQFEKLYNDTQLIDDVVGY